VEHPEYSERSVEERSSEQEESGEQGQFLTQISRSLDEYFALYLSRKNYDPETEREVTKKNESKSGRESRERDD
jgi:hypothetical protein